MKKFTLALSCILLPALVFASPYPDNDRPQYRKGGELVRPDNYRDWVFLPSGFGMNYSPAAAPLTSSQCLCSAVGKPRVCADGALARQNPIRYGRTDGAKPRFHHRLLLWVWGIEVKDSALSEKWAYYSFASNRTGSANPRQACFSCHEQHAAVEHTFVQFYPTLKPIAKKFGSYRQQAENVE